jgi:hypothetical protein
LQKNSSLDSSPLLITSIVYENNTPKFINQISTPCQILIKEGYFNLSTMLNLKSLWMYRARLHPNQSIYHKQGKHDLA